MHTKCVYKQGVGGKHTTSATVDSKVKSFMTIIWVSENSVGYYRFYFCIIIILVSLSSCKDSVTISNDSLDGQMLMMLMMSCTVHYLHKISDDWHVLTIATIAIQTAAFVQQSEKHV